MKYYPVKNLNALTEKIVQLMPPVERFFLSHDTILENSQELSACQAPEIHRKRQKFFLELIDKKIQRLFSAEERKSIRVPSLEDGAKGGVVDHHGILNHPVLSGVNFVPHFFRMFDRAKNGDILTFATGNVPLNNPFHRRGFMIGGNKVNIFPKADKNKIVYGLPRYDFQIVSSLQASHQWKLHVPATQKFLQKIQHILNEIDFSGCSTLGDQLTKINFHLWPLLFDPALRNTTSRLISLEYDDLVIAYLLYVLEHDPDSFITHMLFDEKFRAKTLAHFEGKTGAWDSARQVGTQFFWGFDEQHRHIRLQIENNVLRGGENLAIPWDIEHLSAALRAKKILPGMLLKFSLLLFYMGMKPFAGFGSANYLTVLQREMIDFLQADYPDEVKNISNMIVNNITSVPVLLRRGKNQLIENYFAFDIMQEGGLPRKYFEKINSVPLKFFMTINLNTMYDYAFNLYGQGEKIALKASPQDFEELLGKAI